MATGDSNITDNQNGYVTSGGGLSSQSIGRNTTLLGAAGGGSSSAISRATSSSSAGSTTKGYDDADGSSADADADADNLSIDTFGLPYDATPNSGGILVDDSASVTVSLLTDDFSGGAVASLAAAEPLKSVQEEEGDGVLPTAAPPPIPRNEDDEQVKAALKGDVYFDSSAGESNDIINDDITAYTGDPDLGGSIAEGGAWSGREEAIGQELAADDTMQQEEEATQTYSNMPGKVSSSQVLAGSSRSSDADRLHSSEHDENETEVPRLNTQDSTTSLHRPGLHVIDNVTAANTADPADQYPEVVVDEVAAIDSCPNGDDTQVARLGLHVINDAIVVVSEQAAVVPEDLENGNTSAVNNTADVITVDGEVIKTVNINGREVSKSVIRWIVCALLVVIVAITIPTSVSLSNNNNPIEAVPPFPSPRLPEDGIDIIKEELARQKIEEELARQNRISAILTPLSSKEALENPISPQSKAVQWLLGPSNKRIDPDRNITMPDRNITMIGVTIKQLITERYAISTLYYSLGGEQWAKQDNFLTGTPVRKWSSDLIQADEKGLVTGLFLGENNLQGEIPPEIQHLQRLQHFHVQENFVNGAVPMEMEDLTSLTGFWAQETNLTGSINFFCDLGRSNTTNECDNCGFKVDLGNVQCTCCECCA